MAGTNTSPRSDSARSEHGTAFVPATQILALGAELFGEVQRIIGTDRVRALRVKLGGRVIKEIPVAPLTAAATLGLVLIAVVLSTMSVEVEREPAPSRDSETSSRP